MTTEQTPAPDITKNAGDTELWVERTGKRLLHGPQLARRRGEHRQRRGRGRVQPGRAAEDRARRLQRAVAPTPSCAHRLGDDVDVTIKVSGMSDDDEDRYPAFAEELVVDLSALDAERPRAPHHRRAPRHRRALHGRPHPRRRRDRPADGHRGALMPAGIVEAALAKAVTIPSSTIHAHVDSLRRRNPEATPEQLVRLLEKEYLLVVQSTGGAVGATAAAPAVGTGRRAGAHGQRRRHVLRGVGRVRARGGQRARHRGRGRRPPSRAPADHDPRATPAPRSSPTVRS